MRKSLTWAVVGTTVAAAALSVAGTANAATLRGTSLSIEKSARSITAGQTVTISGQLKSGNTAVDHQAVTLDWVGPNGALHHITQGTTAGPAGNVSFKLRPEATRTYELVFKSAGGYAGSHSGKATVPVNKIGTTLGLSASATSVEVGTKVTLTGTLTAGKTGLSGKDIQLDTVDAQGHLHWTHHAANTKAGTVTFTVEPGSTTTYRLVFPGTWQYKASESKSAKVTVTKVPATLTASEAAGTKAGTETITGTLTAGPKDLGGQTVTLRYKDSKGDWVSRNSNPTVANGTVTFTVKPASATTYELVFGGTSVYTAATSNTVIAG
jgi:hypothetical protein